MRSPVLEAALMLVVFALCFVGSSAFPQSNPSNPANNALTLAEEVGRISADISNAASKLDAQMRSIYDEKFGRPNESQVRLLNQRAELLVFYQRHVRQVAEGSMIVAHSLALIHKVPDKERKSLYFNLAEICGRSGVSRIVNVAHALRKAFDFQEKGSSLSPTDVVIVREALDTVDRHARRLHDVCSAKIREITSRAAESP